MTTDNDFVAEKLGLWHPNQECPSKFDKHREGKYETTYIGQSHFVPAPDLLANPWLLVEALWKRGYVVTFDAPVERIIVDNIESEFDEDNESAEVIDGNLPAALLKATAEMLRRESK